MNVACIGMGWWSDVLADAIQRSGKLKIAACYSRSREKTEKFAGKYNCKAVSSLVSHSGAASIAATSKPAAKAATEPAGKAELARIS